MSGHVDMKMHIGRVGREYVELDDVIRGNAESMKATRARFKEVREELMRAMAGAKMRDIMVDGQFIELIQGKRKLRPSKNELERRCMEWCDDDEVLGQNLLDLIQAPVESASSRLKRARNAAKDAGDDAGDDAGPYRAE